MEHVIFLSYATLDSRTYQIAKIAQRLKELESVKDVLYWEEDADTNIIEFMNAGLQKCDIVVLFCSKYALQSQWVQKEWTAAVQLGKRIIPIFQDHHDIPALLSPNLGLKYKFEDPAKFMQDLYQLIIKKTDDSESFGSLEQQFIAWINENRPDFYINVNLSRYNLQQTQKINLIKNISTFADQYSYKIIKGLQDIFPEEYRFFAESKNYNDNLKYIFWYCPLEEWHPKDSQLNTVLDSLRKNYIWEKDFNAFVILIQEFLKLDFTIAEEIANELKTQLKFSDPEYGLIANTWEELEDLRKDKKEKLFRFNKTLEIAESYYSKGDFEETEKLIKRSTILAAQNKFPITRIEELEGKIQEGNIQIKKMREKIIELRAGSLEQTYAKIIKFIRLEGYNLVPLRYLSLKGEREIKNTAAILLGYIQVYQLFPAFLQLLEEVKEFEQLQMLVAFNQVSTMKTEQIIDVLNDENDFLVFNAIMASGQYYSDKTIQYLMGNLKKDLLIIRVASVATLGLSADPRVIERLQEAFDDPNPVVRLLIISVLVRFRYAKMEDLLLKALKDPAKEVCMRAITILSEMKSEKALQYLIKMYQDKKQNQAIHNAVIQAICEIRSEISVEALFDAIQDKNQKIQELAKETLDSMKPEKAQYIQNLLVKFIESNPFAKAEILHTLERLGKHATEILHEYITNPDVSHNNYKIGAAILLALLKGILLIPDLLDILTKSTRNFMTHFSSALENVLTYNLTNLSDTLLTDDPYIRLLCILALSELRDEYTTELLLLNENDKDLRVRMVLLAVLGTLEDERVLNSFSLVLNNENEDIGLRKIAARGLGRLKHPRAMLQLLSLVLKDTQARVRNAALESIRENVDFFPNEARDTVDKLTNTVNSPIFPSRNKGFIIELLGFIKEPLVFDVLIQMLLNKNEDLLVRSSACKSLGVYEDKRAFEPLKRFSLEFESDYDVQKLVLNSMLKLGDFRTKEYLLSLFTNPDKTLEIRAVIIKTLCNIKDPEIPSLLIGALGEDRQEIWHSASSALISLTEPSITVQLIQSLDKYKFNTKVMGHLRYLLSMRDLVPHLGTMTTSQVSEIQQILIGQGPKYIGKLKMLLDTTKRPDLQNMLQKVIEAKGLS